MTIFPDVENPRPRKSDVGASLELIIKRLSDRLKLFTATNPKLSKGTKKGYMPMVLMLSPAYLSGWEVCPFRSPGCTRACLNTSGMGRVTYKGTKSRTPEEVIRHSGRAQQARLERTRLLFRTCREEFTDHPPVSEEFGAMMIHDINELIIFSKEQNFIPCVRLNGTSDLRWELMPVRARQNIFKFFPEIQFYDYTKHPWRNRKLVPKNYHLTYSLTEQAISGRRMKEYFAHEINTAVVFSTPKNDDLPSTFGNYTVIDGDKYDMRFLDMKGCIVGLRAKGFAQDDSTGFVIDAEGDQENPKQLDFEGGSLFPDLLSRNRILTFSGNF